MKRFALILVATLAIVLNMSAASVKYSVQGIIGDRGATVSLGSESWLSTNQVESDGNYEFSDVPPGLHFIKIAAPGYNVPDSKLVMVNEDGSVYPEVGITLLITPLSEKENQWTHEWHQDESIEGYTITSYVNTRPEVEFLGKKIVPSDVPYAAVLKDSYHVILSDEELPWAQEYAYRLVETLKTLLSHHFDRVFTKFILTDRRLTDDITFEKYDGGNILYISKDAFTFANPFLVNLDGVRGRFFSKRLHHALTKFVTDFGTDKGIVNHILNERFGVSVEVPDYKELTAGTTDEDENSFQEFGPSELVAIINMFEELPEGFHRTPHLNYLLRRMDGHRHPRYPEAAGVAWCQDNGYIEFMNSDLGQAFHGTNENFETQRLILHEKTHFLWAYTFSKEIREDWTTLGGWYRDPNTEDGWSTDQTTEFVSPYAHAKSPNEDMAESVAFYLKDPEKLQSRASKKYEFIRDRIMHGTRYISMIPDHLSFEVLNLSPDYDFPGKIKSVRITVDGAPEEDKVVTMEIELNHIDGFQDEASEAVTRISSEVFLDQNGEKKSQFEDLHMYPVDGNNHLLRGEVVISKYSKMGYWTCGDIVVRDMVGNQRFESRNDCVTNVYVNNPLEDVESPVYKKGSLEYKLTEGEEEGHHVQILKVSFEVTDNVDLRHTFIRVDNDHQGWSDGGTALTDFYGGYNPETKRAEVNFIIPDFYPSANYFVTFLKAKDLAGTELYVPFSDAEGHEPIKRIYIETPNPDYNAPEIDLNRIVVYAEPTHPENPDGETLVTVNFYGRDDISGFSIMDYWFRDPQGLIHGNYWFYHQHSFGRFFEGDPTLWERYKLTHILPQGSAPGIWGLYQLEINDKAGNSRTYNFVETMIFEPDDNESDYQLFSELDDNVLTINFIGDVYGFTWRIINEDTGAEINGADSDEASRMSAAKNLKRVSDRRGTSIDVSSLGDGSLIVIANAFDESGNVVAVRSARVHSVPSGITDIIDSDGTALVNVHNLQGILVKRNVSPANWSEGLPKGLYIVGNEKRIIR